MKAPSSREELYKRYKDMSKPEWEQYVLSLTDPPHAINTELYHLSFARVEGGVWSPRAPRGSEASSEADPIYGEMLPSRISTSSDIEGCWAGIFCYLATDLKVEKQQPKEIIAYLYKAKPLRGCRVLTPETLTKEYLIQDAHMTHEYCLIGDVEMTIVSEITFKNTYTQPDSKWVSGHPFNEKRYGKTNYAPMVILNNVPIKPETNMSTLKLNFSNEVLQNQLSLEAMTNPLGLLAEGMSTKFTVLLTQLNKLNATFAHSGISGNKFTVKPRKLRRITDNNNYMQLMNYGAGVPPGFIGPLVPYMGLLEETLNLYKNIRTDITKPVASEIGVILANPDRLRSSSISPLTKLDFHDKQREAFAKRISSYYNPKSSRDEIAYSRLFNDNSEFLRSGELAVSLEDIMNRVNLEVRGVLEDVGIIAGLTDKLAIRIMQDKQTYSINASIANELSIVISKTADSVSFLSALLVMGEEAVGIVDNLAKKIN